MMRKSEFKKDIYSKNRGGYSEFLHLYCNKCRTFITKYQKDGGGDLLRIYVDRVVDNKNIKAFKTDKKLFCPKCKRMLGLGHIYPKEKRPAYVLFQGQILKKPTNYLRHLFCLIIGVFK